MALRKGRRLAGKEHGANGNTWAQDGKTNRKLEKITE
jgi:hypothetical protein